MATLGEWVWFGGAAVVGITLAQTGWLALDHVRRSGERRRHRLLELELLEERIAAARKRRVAEEHRTLQWAGWRKFEVRRKVREDATGDVYSLYLYPHDGKPVPDYLPGQYLTLRLDVPGNDRAVVRCYSISDGFRGDHYRLTIKRAMPPSDKPEAPRGVASCYICEGLCEGSILDVQPPKGAFYLDIAQQAPVVLIGGGIGITPMVAMLNTLLAANSDREIWLFYGLRNTSEHLWKDELFQIAREHPNVRLHVCYSKPAPGDVQGRDYHHQGRVDIELFKKLLPSNNYEYFMCGPPSMMNSMVEGLAEWGVPEAQVHLETFGPSAKKKEKKQVAPAPEGAAPAAGGFAINFRKSGKTVNWNPQFEDLWKLAEANEIRIDAGCMEGNCGSCMVALLSGDVEYHKKPGFDCESGSCLTCCAVPKGPLEIDA